MGGRLETLKIPRLTCPKPVMLGRTRCAFVIYSAHPFVTQSVPDGAGHNCSFSGTRREFSRSLGEPLSAAVPQEVERASVYSSIGGHGERGRRAAAGDGHPRLGTGRNRQPDRHGERQPGSCPPRCHDHHHEHRDWRDPYDRVQRVTEPITFPVFSQATTRSRSSSAAFARTFTRT